MGMTPTQLVADRADRLSGRTTTSILNDHGERFPPLATADPDTIDDAIALANDLQVSLLNSDHDSEDLAIRACRHAGAVDADVSYCEGYARLAPGTRPDRRTWVTVNNHVIELADPKPGTFIDPPEHAEYFGVAIPAGRALHFSSSDDHSRPFASYLDTKE